MYPIAKYEFKFFNQSIVALLHCPFFKERTLLPLRHLLIHEYQTQLIRPF